VLIDLGFLAWIIALPSSGDRRVRRRHRWLDRGRLLLADRPPAAAVAEANKT